MFTEKKDLIAYARLNFMRIIVANLVVLVSSIFLGLNSTLDIFLFLMFNIVATFSYIAIVGYPHYLVLQLTPKSDAGKYKYHSANAMLPFSKKELYWRYMKSWFMIAPITLCLLWLLYQRYMAFVPGSHAAYTSSTIFFCAALFFYLQAAILKIRSLAKNKSWMTVQPRIFIIDVVCFFLIILSPAIWLRWMVVLGLLIYCLLEFMLASDDLENMHQ